MYKTKPTEEIIRIVLEDRRAFEDLLINTEE